MSFQAPNYSDAKLMFVHGSIAVFLSSFLVGLREKDIDEVLQSLTIFSNVGKGTLAKSADLIAVFGTDDEEVVCREVGCGLCCK